MANNHSTLTGLFTDIADAIREKTGGTEPIVADAFPEAISMIEAGGGTEIEDAMVTRTLTEYSNDRVTSIGDYALARCSALTNVNFPKVTFIGSNAFSGCINLTDVNLPVAATIGMSAFMNCYSLSYISLPAATTLSAGAFSNCTKLTDVNLPAVTMVVAGAFSNCTKLTDVNLPVAATIGSNAFRACSSITEISLPAATVIGSSAFYGCHNLISLVLGASKVCTLSGSNAFTSTPIGGYSASAGQYGSIYVPMSLLTSYQAAARWSYFSARFVGLPYFRVYHGEAATQIGLYNAMYGMTWGDWINSWMNTAGYKIVDDTHIEHPDYVGVHLYNYSGVEVTVDDVIVVDSTSLDATYYIGESLDPH